MPTTSGENSEPPGSFVDTESTQLLSQEAGTDPEANSWPHLRQRLSLHLSCWKIVYLVGLFVFLIDFGENLRSVPELRLLESALCKRYYLQHDKSLVDSNGNVDEVYCKLDVLQSQLALLRGWLSLLRGVMQIALVLPFGVVAGVKRRILVLALSEIGLFLSNLWVVVVCVFSTIFPIEAVWASALFLVIGGGSSVLNALAFALLADSVAPEKRISAFFYVSTANLAVELLAPPTGARLMLATTVYTALTFGFLIEFIGLFVLLALPKTVCNESSHNGLASIHSSESIASEAPDEDDTIPTKGTFEKILHSVQHMFKPLKNIITLILTDRNVLLALPAFLVNRLARQITAMLLQYLSKELGWKLASISYLLSVRPAVNIVLFPIVIPMMNHLLIYELHYQSPTADLVIAKFSLIALVSGCLVLAVAKTLIPIVLGLLLFSLGWGFNNSVQLFVTSRVEKSQIAILYTAISLIDAIGGLGAAPILAVSFSAGLHLGGVLFGLPLFVASVLYVLAGVGIWFLKL